MRVNKLFGTLVVTCILVGSVRGEAIIDVGSHNLQPDSAGQKVKLYVTGDDQVTVTGFKLMAQIGTESKTPVFETTVFESNDHESPREYFIDTEGSIWGGAEPSGQAFDPPRFVQESVVFGTSHEITLPDNKALLLTLTIDTSGFFSGQFDLRLKDLVYEDQVLPDSEFIRRGEDGDAVPLYPTITNGTVNVVPEPASVMLLSVGGLFAGMVGFFARRRGKQ